MVFPSIRFLVFAAAVSVALGAVDVTALTREQINALTVTSEVQVEALASAVAAANNVAASNAFEGFLTAYSTDIAAGTLSVTGHNQRIDAFLLSINSAVPGFSTTANGKIGAAVVDFFKFQLNAHAASWEVMKYGASAAQAKLGNAEVADSLAKLDTYMSANVATASGEELQAECDTFFAEADAKAKGFQSIAYDTISVLYKSLWEQKESDELVGTSGREEEAEATPGSGPSDGNTSNKLTSQEEVDVTSPTPSSESSSPSPTPTTTKDNSDGVPSSSSTLTPAPTSRATAFVPVNSITVAAIALAYTALLM